MDFHFVDIHCHILPLPDDGPDDIEGAVRLLGQLAGSGVRVVCCTPYLRKNVYETSDAEVIKKFEALKSSTAEAGIQAELYLSREYYADDLFCEKLDRGEILPLGRDHILLELPSEATEREMRDHIEVVTAHGYTPLLAHPERCRLIREYPAAAERLVRAGALLQLNAGSIMGEEGLQQKNLCRKLLKAKLVYVVSPDAQSTENSPIGAAAEWLAKKAGSRYAEQLLWSNPRRILTGE